MGENVSHTKAIYPGSFDPVTLGHLDIINRSRTLFDEVVVAIATNVQKQPFLNVDERLTLLREVTADMDGVTVMSFSGLLVDFARSISARVAIRGLRAVSDFEFEFQMALTNRSLDPELETVFLMPKGRYIFLSSGLIKELWLLGGSVSKFVPDPVAEYLRNKPKPESASSSW
jgi:pantetheine-phosphate adenylyltransferase